MHHLDSSSIIDADNSLFENDDKYNTLKNTGKACGVDGLAAEHFIYTDAIIHNYTFILFI